MREEFKIGYNADLGLALTIGKDGGSYYRPEIPIQGFQPLFTTTAMGSEKREGWSTLVPGTRFVPPPQLKRRIRSRRELVVLADPFYFAFGDSNPPRVGGPFTEIELDITGPVTQIGLANTGPEIGEWFAATFSSPVSFNYFDNTGSLTNSYTAVDSSNIFYTGGGVFEDYITTPERGFGTLTDSTNSSGGVTTTTGRYTTQNYGDNTVTTVGTFTNTNTFIENIPDPTTNDNWTRTQGSTRLGSANYNNGRQKIRPDGLTVDIFPVTYNIDFSENDSETLNRSNGAYSRTFVKDNQESATSSGMESIFPDLSLPYIFEESSTEDDTVDTTINTSGGSYSESISKSDEFTDYRNLQSSGLFKTSEDGTGGIYFIFKEQSLIDNQTTETQTGTVGGRSGISYPDMRSPNLVGLTVNFTLSSFDGVTQGSSGGWFEANTGSSILDNIPGLNCPTPEIRYRTRPSEADFLRADYDGPIAYGDNQSRFFLSEGDEADVFCGFNYTVVPSPFRPKNGLIGGTQVNLPDPITGVNNQFFPSQNITRDINTTNVLESRAIWEMYVYVAGLGSLRVSNSPAADSNIRQAIENVETLSPQWGSLSDPSYRGIFTISNTGANHFTIQSPIQTKRTFTQTLNEVYTDPQSINPTTSSNVVSYLYETEINDFLDTLVGRKVFIVNTDGPNWVRFEGEITDADTFYQQGFISTPAVDVTGNGFPGQTHLRGLTVNITGSVVLPQRFDEFMDANNLSGNIVYFPYIEGVRNSRSISSWLGVIRSRTTLRLRTAAEINADQDQTTTVIGTMTAAGQFYNNGGPPYEFQNYSEVYVIRRDPTRPNSGLNQGELIIEKQNTPNLAFTTVPATPFGGVYTNSHLSQ